MDKKKVIIISISAFIAGILLTYLLKNSVLSNNSKSSQYFYVSRIISHTPSESDDFQPSSIVKEFNKIFGIKLRYTNYDEKTFWQDKCQLDADPFEIGLMAPLYYACYKKKYDSERVIPIAKQEGCTPGAYVISLDAQPIEPTQLTGKRIGFIRGNSNLIRVLLNEPTTITPESMLDSESSGYLIQSLQEKKIDYIISIGIKLKEDNYILRLNGKKQKQTELNFDGKKIYINYAKNFEIPCVMIAGNSKNNLISSESSKKDFINKINSNRERLFIEKYTANDEKFVPMTREEVENVENLMSKTFTYTFNARSNGNEKGDTRQKEEGDHRNADYFKLDNQGGPPQESPTNEQHPEAEKPGLGGQPIDQSNTKLENKIPPEQAAK
jgi:hypothetical protein